jgi:hypothetical protein
LIIVETGYLFQSVRALARSTNGSYNAITSADDERTRLLLPSNKPKPASEAMPSAGFETHQPVCGCTGADIGLAGWLPGVLSLRFLLRLLPDRRAGTGRSNLAFFGGNRRAHAIPLGTTVSDLPKMAQFQPLETKWLDAFFVVQTLVCD